MNKILTILITVLTALNLQAADIDSLFTRWESLTGSRRVRTGNELLELGYREGGGHHPGKTHIRKKPGHRIRSADL